MSAPTPKLALPTNMMDLLEATANMCSASQVATPSYSVMKQICQACNNDPTRAIACIIVVNNTDSTDDVADITRTVNMLAGVLLPHEQHLLSSYTLPLLDMQRSPASPESSGV
jgi:hypothetical protein